MPVAASPGNLTTAAGTPVSLVLTVLHAGLRPYRWGVSGLPDGLTSDDTGLISGTPTGHGASTSTVEAIVIDANQLSNTMTFTWTITT